ncbi:MAG: hypothetical protein GC168_01635 [Candidatus Hydrogenedens sp.]|nr:hypothetical protein [Candidatus Hydrogenedens sp.]
MQGLKWITGAALLAATVLTAPAAHAELGVDWEVAATQHPFASRQGAAFAVFDGKLWGSGGMIPNACLEYLYTGSELGWECVRYGDLYYKDLWYTEDGSNWTKVLDELPFETSELGYQLIPFRGNLYLFSYDERNLMYSKDGVTWLSGPSLGRAHKAPPFVWRERLWHFQFPIQYSIDGVNWEVLQDGDTVGPAAARKLIAVHNDAVYVFQAKHVWRSTDLIDWTELEGNTDQLDVVSEADVNLFSFAGRLWLGGGFRREGSSDLHLAGLLWTSTDGENWELRTAEYGITRRSGIMIPFKDSIYSFSGAGDPWAYRSIASCEELLGGEPHTADVSGCGTISLSELLRVIQLFSTQGYDCDDSTEDGYAARANFHKIGSEGSPDGEGATEGLIEGTLPPCDRHSADYEEPAWRITLPELLRMV